MSDIKLQPCPFCGVTPKSDPQRDFIFCASCGVEGPFPSFDKIAAWNRRPPGLEIAIIPPEREEALDLEAAIRAVKAEPELPGPMPIEIFYAIQSPEKLANALRIAVRQTKEGIITRLRSIQAAPSTPSPTGNDSLPVSSAPSNGIREALAKFFYEQENEKANFPTPWDYHGLYDHYKSPAYAMADKIISLLPLSQVPDGADTKDGE